MIRNDIKNYLKDKNLDDLFLENRVGIDQPSYRVGNINYNGNNTIVIWNPKTGLIMDYFYDDREDLKEFDISNIFKFEGGHIESNKYFISRDGKLKSLYTNKYLSIYKEAYPSYGLKYFNSSNRTGNVKRALIHVLIAKMFIPNINPDKYKIVDHIDRNKYNYNLNNLRWSTLSENAINVSTKIVGAKYIWEAYEDLSMKNLVFSMTTLELNNSKIYSRHNLSRRLNKGLPYYKGYYWKRKDTELDNYLLKFSINTIDESLWKEVNSVPGLMVHPIGLVKNLLTNNITLGNKRVKDAKSYRVVSKDNKVYLVHRLIAEVFLNNNNPIENKLVVDHISTDILDNRVNNLKICTQLENMNNSTTKKNLGISIIDDSGNIFPTITECADYHKVSRTTINSWIKDPNKDFNYNKHN